MLPAHEASCVKYAWKALDYGSITQGSAAAALHQSSRLHNPNNPIPEALCLLQEDVPQPPEDEQLALQELHAARKVLQAQHMRESRKVCEIQPIVRHGFLHPAAAWCGMADLFPHLC